MEGMALENNSLEACGVLPGPCQRSYCWEQTCSFLLFCPRKVAFLFTLKSMYLRHVLIDDCWSVSRGSLELVASQ